MYYLSFKKTLYNVKYDVYLFIGLHFIVVICVWFDTLKGFFGIPFFVSKILKIFVLTYARGKTGRRLGDFVWQEILVFLMNILNFFIMFVIHKVKNVCGKTL